MSQSTPPPLHQGPTAKEKKYDRQLRLWAASGQAALEDAHVLLINSGPGVVGVETLKNLVLPGVGHFTILDSAVVREEDLGVNFFLQEESVGAERAAETCKYLQELNPDVEGHSISEPVEEFIARPDTLTPYSLIIVVAPVVPDVLSKISAHGTATQTPVFYVHNVGFYIHFSLQLPPAFTIVDIHPEPEALVDLRLYKPWKELLVNAKKWTWRMENMSDHQHGHIPYVFLLLHYLMEWERTHDGKPPRTYKEKTEFRELIRSGIRTSNPEGGEENFDEAIGAVLKSLNEPTLSSTVKEVFNSPECEDLTEDSPNFWLIAHAVSQFHTKHQTLPLPGAIPDMKAVSADYAFLQGLYKTKAREEADEVLHSVRALEKSLERPNPILAAEVDAFCKQAAHIRLIRGRPIPVISPNEGVAWGERAKAAVNALTDESSLILLHIAFLTFDAFYAQRAAEGKARVPGDGADVEDDERLLTGLAQDIGTNLLTQAERELDEEDADSVKTRLGNICAELTRAGGAELHNIAALGGGLVAQEVIKAITRQYVPIDNTCLFDGVRSLSSVLLL
ncbi:hypothetical protein EJ06DRAFT_499738 [Trichodelitschia bisporula]|uniref:NEDD8-activating enzyme E1 regulatory subunit n=1 Tax=Trichodelitschia bisporula TaxID=703511 RepID=A0A6G1HL90_9PEZI|nr:hypothetical protein EJ06DRAFT_499738 [Trichodelitschia bisporula]